MFLFAGCAVLKQFSTITQSASISDNNKGMYYAKAGRRNKALCLENVFYTTIQPSTQGRLQSFHL